MILAVTRFVYVAAVWSLILMVGVRAEPLTIWFTAQVGSANDIDSGDVFNEGYGADLSGQVIAGSLSIDPASLSQLCTGGGGACYADFGAGAVSVSFSLNGVTSTVVSSGTTGYFGGRSSGSVQISDPADGGANYLAVGSTTPDGLVQESIGALFGNAGAFDAYGDGDPATAIGGLSAIGAGNGLVEGGITYMDPDEHLDATILTIEVPEPPGLALFGLALLVLAAGRRIEIWRMPSKG